MWNLRKKQMNKQNKTERDSLTQETNCWFTRLRALGGAHKIGIGLLEVQTSSYKVNNSWDVMYSLENIANNSVIVLFGDRW